MSNLELFHIVGRRSYRVPGHGLRPVAWMIRENLDKDGVFEHNSLMFGRANDNIWCIIIYIKLYIRKTAFF